MTTLFYLIYIPLQILWIPLSIIPLIVAWHQQVTVSKKMGVSQTAIEIVTGRYQMDLFGLRVDPYTVSLIKALPNAAPKSVAFILYPMLIAHKATKVNPFYMRPPSGGHENISEMVPVRTICIDELIDKNLPQTKQLITLGAGMDTRSLLFQRDGLTTIEVDQELNHNFKQEILKTLPDDYSSVTYVAVDFSKDDLFGELEKSGAFRASEKSIYLWEGVTLYLSEENVRHTLRELRDRSASGSRLICDFYANRFLKIGKNSFTQSTLDKTGEAFAFGFDFSSDWEGTLRKFVESEGLQLESAYFMGSESKKGPFMSVAEIRL